MWEHKAIFFSKHPLGVLEEILCLYLLRMAPRMRMQAQKFSKFTAPSPSGSARAIRACVTSETKWELLSAFPHWLPIGYSCTAFNYTTSRVQIYLCHWQNGLILLVNACVPGKHSLFTSCFRMILEGPPKDMLFIALTPPPVHPHCYFSWSITLMWQKRTWTSLLLILKRCFGLFQSLSLFMLYVKNWILEAHKIRSFSQGNWSSSLQGPHVTCSIIDKSGCCQGI